MQPGPAYDVLDWMLGWPFLAEQKSAGNNGVLS